MNAEPLSFLPPGSSDPVFEAHGGDFMKDVLHTGNSSLYMIILPPGGGLCLNLPPLKSTNDRDVSNWAIIKVTVS